MGLIKVKKNRYQPVRYEIYLDAVLIFAVSSATLSHYVSLSELKQLRKGRSLNISLPLEKLAEDEKQSLTEYAYLYLSKAERSPYHLRMWFLKRNVPEDWINEITRLCLEKSFLNPERFAASFTAKRQSQANKPWQQVRYELTCHEIPEKIIDRYAYDDVEVLKKAYFELSWGRKHPVFASVEGKMEDWEQLEPILETLKSTLQKQGFSYHTIDQFVRYVKDKLSDGLIA